MAEKPKTKVMEMPKTEELAGAMAPPSQQKTEVPKMSATEVPKALSADIGLDSLSKTSEIEVVKPATKP